MACVYIESWGGAHPLTPIWLRGGGSGGVWSTGWRTAPGDINFTLHAFVTPIATSTPTDRGFTVGTVLTTGRAYFHRQINNQVILFRFGSSERVRTVRRHQGCIVDPQLETILPGSEITVY